jgi:hypothetical protein
VQGEAASDEATPLAQVHPRARTTRQAIKIQRVPAPEKEAEDASGAIEQPLHREVGEPRDVAQGRAELQVRTSLFVLQNALLSMKSFVWFQIRLCAVAHHQGTCNGGHYTATCANLGDGA